jgi:hypothetical protein
MLASLFNIPGAAGAVVVETWTCPTSNPTNKKQKVFFNALSTEQIYNLHSRIIFSYNNGYGTVSWL